MKAAGQGTTSTGPTARTYTLPEISLSQLDRAADRTRRYSRFSRSAGGLGTALGGALCLIAYLAGAWSELPTLTRWLLATFPIVWLLVKEMLRSRFYQRYGKVIEPMGRGERRLHLGLTASVAIVAAGITIFVVPKLAATPSAAGFVYLAFVVALPFVVWKWLWSWQEFVVGVFLFCQAAVVGTGGRYPLASQPALPFLALTAVVIGLLQHREFRRLESETRETAA